MSKEFVPMSDESLRSLIAGFDSMLILRLLKDKIITEDEAVKKHNERVYQFYREELNKRGVSYKEED